MGIEEKKRGFGSGLKYSMFYEFQLNVKSTKIKRSRPSSSKQITPSQTLISCKPRIIGNQKNGIGTCDPIKGSASHAHFSNVASSCLSFQLLYWNTYTLSSDKYVVQGAKCRGGGSGRAFSSLLSLRRVCCIWLIGMLFGGCESCCAS
jgi:hypothetical protein